MPTRPLTLLAVLFAATLSARASDPIPAPADGKSATVIQPHVTVELIPETTSLQIGKPFDVALHLHMDPAWHTYWINPGDAGLATTIKWTLPPGLTAGPIQWPVPEIHAMGPLTTYGYGGDVYLLTTITPISSLAGYLPPHLEIKAHADWLVCKEECIPGKADLAVTLNFTPTKTPQPDPASAAFFAAARARLPVPNTRWDVTAYYAPKLFFEGARAQDGFWLMLKNKNGVSTSPVRQLRFFPEQPNVLSAKASDNRTIFSDEGGLRLPIVLAQNGEKPDHLSGVLVSDRPLIDNSKAIYLASFPVAVGAAASPSESDAVRSPVGSILPVASASTPFLLTILGFAFLGGLILNLMPCVLPVLSLKVFSLIRHAGENSGTAWRQGVAFAAGVVVSFWILAGLLLVLRAAGNHLGWGFQMQSPGFVMALTFLFFLLGLNLFGVFELGASLVGLDARASSHLGGLASSFANGALATLAATPCTAPFMGSSIGFAAQQPPAISLLVFTFLALGMAAPYLALTTFPGALRFVPKPGPWMESLKQFMGFLLLGTVIFLVYVFGALVGQEQVPTLLSALLLAGFGAWIFGRWTTPVRSPAVRFFSVLLSLVLLFAAIEWGMAAIRVTPESQGKTSVSSDGWRPYSAEAVKQALAEGRPAFVDFTAAWCLSCKVNEQIALDVDSTKQAFAQKNVALFRGDWTHSDPEISKTLQEYHRDGVPLYLLYSPKDPTEPQVLPEILTPGIVHDALQKL